MKIGSAIGGHIARDLQIMNERREQQGKPSFQDCLEKTYAKAPFIQDHIGQQKSPFLQGYETWKATRLPQDIPDSKGLTEENLSWLADRYPGETFTSLYDTVEATEIMYKMGIIDQEHYEWRMENWSRMCSMSASETAITYGPIEKSSGLGGGFHLIGFVPTVDTCPLPPIPNFKDTDALLAWLCDMGIGSSITRRC